MYPSPLSKPPMPSKAQSDSTMSNPHNKPSNLDSERKEQNYRFPLSIKGDPWRNCFDVLLKEDDDHYEVWKDEIQNLLIFAGLFSAVVTAFSIDSYKSLKPDPNQTMILLLTQITSRLDNSTSVVTPTIIPPFVPSSASVRINIYWFFSLLLSLTTVLVGIITMQWLREYRRYKNNLSSKRAFAQRNMRFESLKAWHVRHVLTSLPLLLQAALLLFIIGIIEFLLDLSHLVAIPCIMVAAFTLLFHFYTTVSPAFQCYWYQLESNNKGPTPPPCPYKSPQAWAFHSCTQVWGLSHIWRAALNALHNLYRFIRFTFSLSHGKPKSLGSMNWSLLTTPKILPLSSWNNIDLMYLSRRHPLHHDSDDKYDAARGLARIIKHHSHSETIAFSSYHCFSEFSWRDIVQGQILNFMSPILQDGVFKSTSLLKPDQRGSISRQEVLIDFLDALPQSSPKNPNHGLVWKHQTELLIQACSTQPYSPSQVSQSAKGDVPEWQTPFRPVCLLPRFVKQVEYLKENVRQWDDGRDLTASSVVRAVIDALPALKIQLKELHHAWPHPTVENLSDEDKDNNHCILTFLEQFSLKSPHHVISETGGARVWSSQKGKAELDERKAEVGTSYKLWV